MATYEKELLILSTEFLNRAYELLSLMIDSSVFSSGPSEWDILNEVRYLSHGFFIRLERNAGQLGFRLYHICEPLSTFVSFNDYIDAFQSACQLLNVYIQWILE